MDIDRARNIFSSLLGGKDQIPCKIRYWDGSEQLFGEQSPAFVVHFKTPDAVEEIFSQPSVGFGETYSRGLIEVEGDLASALELAYHKDLFTRLGVAEKARIAWGAIRARGRRSAREQVQAHYDRGNDFYRLWLDSGMNYSCAYFKRPDMDLGEAQRDKNRHVLNKLRLEKGQSLLDIGCGWGSLLIEAARSYGVYGVGVTLSEQQYHLANQRIVEERVPDRVEIRLQDYRELPSSEIGLFERVASVGMFEHVGREGIPTFFGQVARILQPGGLLLLHTIGRAKEEETDPWIRKHIFPGGYLPALGEIVEAASESGFDFIDLENLRSHYDLTLGHWIRRFEAQKERVVAQMGEEFTRMWRLYLHGSQMAFRHGNAHVFQFLFSRGRRHDWPLTRDWLYKGS